MRKNEPLASRMRPKNLEEFIGQNHIIGHGRLLRRAIQADQLSSIIFYGPPGSGKTTLAQIIANTTKALFISLNAVLAGVKDIREAIEQAKSYKDNFLQKTILFVDEVHRFNKSQQDALLPHVENGTVILIGATTENPYFEVNKALVSRSRIFQLRNLEDEDIKNVVISAIKNKERGYGTLDVDIKEDALEHIVRMSNGDARSALNALELAIETIKPNEENKYIISLDIAEESIQKRAILYDKDGDSHYDTISAFIKSVRGSDPDASLYWLSKMIYAGEEPRFIFRRMLILASEDIGMADPNALNFVVSAAKAFEYVGMPEGQYHLSQACLYLATAPKSNTTMSFFDAMESVKKEARSEVPNHLKDTSRDKDDFGHGKGYLYPHAYRDHWVEQQYLPSSLQGKLFYNPSDSGFEKNLKESVIKKRELQFDFLSNSINYLSEFDSENTKNNWSKRTNSQVPEVLEKVRNFIFEYNNVNKETLFLDITGGSGLLSWEAIRKCTSSGVWTRCDNEKELENMNDWIKHVSIMNRPEIFISKMDDIKDFFYKLDYNPKFDLISALSIKEKYNLDSSNFESLLTFFKTIISKDGKIMFAERDLNSSQFLFEILSEQLPLSLFNKLKDLEIDFRNKKDIQIKYDGFNLLTKKFVIKRYFSLPQIKKWFEPNSKATDSIITVLKENLDDKDFIIIKNTVFDVMADRHLNWSFSYNFITN